MTRFIVEKDGERQNVTSLEGYGDWAVVDQVDWITPLSVLREQKWVAIKVERDSKTVAETPFGPVQADLKSLVALGQLMHMPKVEFTFADNSTRKLHGPEIATLNRSVASHLNEVHLRSQELRRQIDLAQNEAELDLIRW